MFHVETDGSFTTEELVLRAVETLRDRATELKEAVQLKNTPRQTPPLPMTARSPSASDRRCFYGA